jgi:hypothetical protein
MKKKFSTYKNRSSRALLVMLAGLFILASCTKKDVSTPTASGPPTIERIRLTDPSTKDSSLTQTTLGSTIAIVGTNLATAQKVLFNGYSLNVNPVYATDNILVITVHDSVPTIATNPNVKDELTVITAGGQVTYKFKILPPRPEVSRIGNEYAKPGETVTLYGRYFYFVDTVKFGAVNVTSGITTTGTTLSVTVPAGVDLSTADVIVRSKSGISVANRNTKFYNAARSGTLVNWDDKTPGGNFVNFGWGLDASKKVGTNLGFTSVSENYAVIDQNVPANYGWNNDKVINMNSYEATINNGSIWPVSATNFAASTALSSLDLKFEISSLFPVGNLQAQVWQADFANTISLKDFVMSADGKWYTVTINLGNMVKGSSKLGTYGELIKQNELRLLFQNPTTADIPAKFAVDNIRIVNNVRS